MDGIRARARRLMRRAGFFVALAGCSVCMVAAAGCSRDAVFDSGGDVAGEMEKTTSAPSGSPGGSAAGASKVRLFPAEGVKCTSVLRIEADPYLLAGARISWHVNGVPVPDAASREFPCRGLARNDTVMAVLVHEGTEYPTAEVRIENSPPSIRNVRFEEIYLKAGMPIHVRVDARDPDGDPVRLTYRWFVNDELAGYAEAYEEPLKRNDRIRVEIASFDGLGPGETTVLETRVQNSPPTASKESERVAGDVYEVQIRADDPDGDPVSYTLLEGPDGMEIEPQSGRLKWPLEKALEGTFEVKVQVEDGQGGASQFIFNVTHVPG